MSQFDASVFKSPDAPEGFNTVWGWLAEFEPGALYFMEEPGAACVEYQDQLTRIAALTGAAMVVVPSPGEVQDTGGPAVATAFPYPVLEAFFHRVL